TAIRRFASGPHGLPFCSSVSRSRFLLTFTQPGISIRCCGDCCSGSYVSVPAHGSCDSERFLPVRVHSDAHHAPEPPRRAAPQGRPQLPRGRVRSSRGQGRARKRAAETLPRMGRRLVLVVGRWQGNRFNSGVTSSLAFGGAVSRRLVSDAGDEASLTARRCALKSRISRIADSSRSLAAARSSPRLSATGGRKAIPVPLSRRHCLVKGSV